MLTSRRSYCSELSLLIILALSLFRSLTAAQNVSSLHALQNISLPSKAPRVYVIYSFVEGTASDSENEKIRLHLGMILAPADVQEYGGDYTGVEFWRVKLDEVQRNAFLQGIPFVSISIAMKYCHRKAKINEIKGSNL